MKRSSLVKTGTHNDIFFTIFFSILWTRKILVSYLRVIIMNLPVVSRYADMIISVAIVVFFCFALPTFLRRVYVKDMALFLLLCAIYFSNYLFYEENRTYFWQNSREIILHVFPLFFLGLCLYDEDTERLLHVIQRVSLFSVVGFCVYTLAFRVIDESTLRAGDMYSAYLLLPHVCLTFSLVIRKPNAGNIAVFAMGTLMLLFLGTRGALLCLCICAILMTLAMGRMKKPGLFLMLGVFAMVVLFALGFLDLLYSLGEKLHLSLRILNKIEQNALTDSTGRNNISAEIWRAFKERPILGRGLFADRTINGGKYAHNFFLECLVQLGLCGAIPLIVITVRLFYRGYSILRLEKRENDICIFITLFCCSVLKLLFSNSYLLEGNLYLLIGYCCAICRGKPAVFKLQKELNGPVERRKLRR